MGCSSKATTSWMDTSLQWASKPFCYEFIVSRPLILWRSVKSSLGSLNRLKLCFPLLLWARLFLVYLCHQPNQLYIWASTRKNMKHGSNIKHPHRLPTWLLLQVHMPFLLLDCHRLLTQGLQLIWVEFLPSSPSLLLPLPICMNTLQMVVCVILNSMDWPNLLSLLLYIMFYIFLSFLLTFFRLVLIKF